MPSDRAASIIPESLVEGESREDFAFMLDSLTTLRIPFHPKMAYEEIEAVGGLILCLLVTPKPDKYRAAMGEFRLYFRNLVEDRRKRAGYLNSILPSALLLASADEIEFQPSLYFSPFGAAYRRFPPSPYLPEDYLYSVREVFPSWY